MAVVHVFVSTGRFASQEQLRAFVEPVHTEDGDAVPSPFIAETGLTGYEPACIESVHAESAVPLRQLLRDASWAGQWIARLDPEQPADSAIAVFPPNLLASPQGSSLEFRGAFAYDPG